MPLTSVFVSIRDSWSARRISSAALSADELAAAVHRHGAIENDLHWRLDVTLHEEACAVRRGHTPRNLATLRRLILNMLKHDAAASPKLSLRLRRKRAEWDDNERARVLEMQLL